MNQKASIPANVRYILTVLGLLLGINTLLRIAFMLYNSQEAAVLPLKELLMGFLVGIRFDLTTIMIFNGLILLFMAMPFRCNLERRTYKYLNILLILANIPILLVNFIDMVYYGFADKRMTHELFTTRSDFGSFKPELLMEWWWVFLLFAMLVWIFYRILNRFSIRQFQRVDAAGYRASLRDWALTFLLMVFMYGGMRGGIRQPITVDAAFVGEDTFTGNLALNSAFTVLSSVDWGGDEPIHLVPEADAIAVTRSMVRNRFDGDFISPQYPLLRRAEFDGPENKYNVVFLIIESLNASKVGCLNPDASKKGLTPNLDSLVRHGRMYRNYYSNAVRSVEAVPALLNSMPDIFTRPTIWSHFTENAHNGLGNMYKSRGYETAFFCGAHNGTMGFDKYSKVCGIERYYGMNEYPRAEQDFNGFWGCHDGPFMQWMGEQQSALKEPFLSVFFSISNHHPFTMTLEMGADIAAKPLSPMEKTTMYTDRVIGEYFKKVRQYDWFERTIFVVTGDHCFHEYPDPSRSLMDNFRVPMLLVGPCIEPGFDDRLSNHVSIMPTLIELLRLDTWHSSTAVSLFDPAPPFAINSLMGVTTLAMDSVAYSSNFEARLPPLVLRDGRWCAENPNAPLDLQRKSEMDFRLRSVFQTLQHARVTDRLHAPPAYDPRLQ